MSVTVFGGARELTPMRFQRSFICGRVMLPKPFLQAWVSNDSFGPTLTPMIPSGMALL